MLWQLFCQCGNVGGSLGHSSGLQCLLSWVHSVLGCSGHSSPVGPLLLQLCFSISPSTVARPASLPLPLQVPGQGLASGIGCWLPVDVSDPAPCPPQYLLGHWFLSHSLPQILILDHLLPSDFIDAPQTGVEEGLNLLLHCLLSAMSHIHRARLTSHWSLRCGVWFSCWFFQMPRCFWAWRKLLVPCQFWLWHLLFLSSTW